MAGRGRPKKKEEPFVFKYKGFELRKDAIYILKDKTVEEVEEKYDPELKRKVKIKSEFNSSVGTSKFPNRAAGEVVQCPFRQGRWDTGFYESSPIWSHLDSETRALKVRQLQDFIVKPYEAIYGEGVLDNKNDEFWEGGDDTDINKLSGIITVDKYNKGTFNMSNPRHRLELWIIMMQGVVAPKGKEKNGQYPRATYILVDDKKNQSSEKEASSKKRKALRRFMLLQEEAPKELDYIAVYADVYKSTTAHAIDEDTKFHYFNKFLERTTSNIDRFNTTASEFEAGGAKKDEIVTFFTIQKLVAKNMIRKEAGQLVYEGVLLGKNQKAAARKLVTDSALSEIAFKISEIDI